MAPQVLHTVRRIEKEVEALLMVEPYWWLISLVNLKVMFPSCEDNDWRFEPLRFVYVVSPYIGATVGLFAKVFRSVQVGRRRRWSIALGGFLLLVVAANGHAVWGRSPAFYGLAALIAAALGLLVGIGAWEAREVGESRMFSPLFGFSELRGRPAAEGEKRRSGPELRRFCARRFLFTLLTAALAIASLLLAQKMSRIPHDDAIMVFLVLYLLFAILSAFSLVGLARNITVLDIPTLLGRDDDDSEEEDG